MKSMPGNRRLLVWILPLSVISLFAFLTAGRLNRPLCVDEPWVAAVVRGGVYPPHEITAPPVYYFPAVLSSRILGATNASIRYPAFLFGLLLVVSPILVRRLTRGWLAGDAMFPWVALIGVASPIGFYAARMKQYTAEALTAVLLLALGLWLASEPRSGRRLGIYSLVAVFAVLTTDSAIFVIAGTALTLGPWLLWRTRREPGGWHIMGRFCAAFGTIAIAFLAAYFAYLKPGRQLNEWTTEFFRSKTSPEFFDGSLSFVVSRTAHWLGHYLGLTRFLLAMTLAVIGIWAARSLGSSEGRERLWVLGGFTAIPGLLALFASGLSLYPYGEVRLMAFLFPGFAMVVSEAWISLLGLSRRRWWAVLLVLVGLGFLILDFRNGLLHESYARTYMGVIK